MVGPDPVSLVAMTIPALMRVNFNLGIFVLFLFVSLTVGFFLKKNANEISLLKESMDDFKRDLCAIKSHHREDKDRIHERINAMNETLSGINKQLELIIKMKLEV